MNSYGYLAKISQHEMKRVDIDTYFSKMLRNDYITLEPFDILVSHLEAGIYSGLNQMKIVIVKSCIKTCAIYQRVLVTRNSTRRNH